MKIVPNLRVTVILVNENSLDSNGYYIGLDLGAKIGILMLNLKE